jgi:hypothetical protein
MKKCAKLRSIDLKRKDVISCRHDTTIARVEDLPLWITHILPEGDHRMNHVQPWAARQQTLSIYTGQQVSERYWSDDRLALVLDALSGDKHKQANNATLMGPRCSKPPRRWRQRSVTLGGACM